MDTPFFPLDLVSALAHPADVATEITEVLKA